MTAPACTAVALEMETRVMTTAPAHDIICWITLAEVVFVEFHWLYRPLTAHPFQNTALYREVPPNPALAPWVRCFWGTDRLSPRSLSGPW